MFGARMLLPVAVAVLPIGAQLLHLLLLLVAPGLIAAIEVGVVDDAAAPVAATVVLPAVAGNDIVKILAKRIQRYAVGYRLVHGGAHVGKHVHARHTRHHKGGVMFRAVDVGIALRG